MLHVRQAAPIDRCLDEMTQAKYVVAVVDDDTSVRKALSRLLSSAGFVAEAYSDGAQFLESLARAVPNCAVVDLHMPNMSGLELQARIAACGLHVPVIIITAHDEPTLRARALTAGAIGYLAKPFPDKVLLDAVTEGISRLKRTAHDG
jgi:FixJ family two-component response regulator